MPSTYFLVFLLGLLPLSTLTIAEQYGSAARAASLDHRGQRTFMDRFYMRGSRTKFQNHPSESVEKSLEKASSSSEDAMMQEAQLKPSGRLTGEKVEKGSQVENDGFPTKKNSWERTHERKPADCSRSAKMTELKTEEARKYMAADSPSKAKRNHFYDLEDIN